MAPPVISHGQHVVYPDNMWNQQTLDTFPGTRNNQQSPQSVVYTSPQQVPTIIGEAPGARSQPHYGIIRHRNSGSSSHSSGLHVPSLTTSASPASDMSEGQAPGSFTSGSWTLGKQQSVDSSHGSESHMAVDSSTAPPYKAPMPGLNTFPPPAEYGMFGARPERRESNASDGTGVSDVPSSRSSIYQESIEEGVLPSEEVLRRASANAQMWAQNFQQMSLHDARMPPSSDPFTASQMAQQANATRPGFPSMVSANGSHDKMPSLGDVKDLWKLFMSEPISGPVMASAQNGGENGENNGHPIPITPRPGMGPRAMSKSNSMPDLTSPIANNQVFFSTYLNGPTPKPTQPQSSYTQSQVPEPAPIRDDHVVPDEVDDMTMKRWRDQLKNRQVSFEFAPKLKAKIKSNSPADGLGADKDNTAASGDVKLTSASGNPVTMQPVKVPAFAAPSMRPRASVIQGALDQTLAPERAPSFGFDSLPTPMKGAFTPRPSKFTSAMARPGNKRLASQTLFPSESGKVNRSGDEIWSTSGDLTPHADPSSRPVSELFSIPGALSSGTGMTPGVNVANQAFNWPVAHENTPAGESRA